MDVIDRLLARVDKSDPNGCWVWTGPLTADGYARMWVNRRNTPVHRVSYEHANGPIPQGMQVDHTCYVRNCVRPEHLRLLTPADNSWNRGGAMAGTASGVRNVVWCAQTRKWRVIAERGGVVYHGGRYLDLADATKAAADLRSRLTT